MFESQDHKLFQTQPNDIENRNTYEKDNKTYGSYDYFDDLLKSSKTWKFTPLTKNQGAALPTEKFDSASLIHSSNENRNIIFKAKRGFGKTGFNPNHSDSKFSPSKCIESKYSRKNYKNEIQQYFHK